MDSCNVPGTIHYCKNILPESLDTCEGGWYSYYISADMYITPCSFDQYRRNYVPLQGSTVEEAWNGESFNAFRERMRRACLGCDKKELCMGGCPLMPEIVFCDDDKRHIEGGKLP